MIIYGGGISPSQSLRMEGVEWPRMHTHPMDLHGYLRDVKIRALSLSLYAVLAEFNLITRHGSLLFPPSLWIESTVYYDTWTSSREKSRLLLLLLLLLEKSDIRGGGLGRRRL